MESKTDLYIGPKGRPNTCPVCMRTKEDAVAEQLRVGSPCGNERCEFRSEIELVASILKAPYLQQIKSLTSESIETNKKTYELLVTLRESVREMKEGLNNSSESKVTVDIGANLFNNEQDGEINCNSEQLQSIMDRIDHSTRTMSKLIQQLDGKQRPVSLPISSQTYKKDLPEDDFNKRIDEAFAKLDKALAGMREVVEEMKKESDPNSN